MYEFKALDKTVSLKTSNNTYTWGDAKSWVLFAGPDIIEDEGMVLETAQEIKKITTELGIPWIYKCSFDKANRQSIDSFRGPGMENALTSLEKVKAKVGCDLITDVHDITQVDRVAEVADVIQIPAFLCRQTDLVVAAAKTGKVLNIKKGQFMAPWDIHAIAKKAVESGNSKLLLCERGVSFGYNTLITDPLSTPEMRKSGFPVVMDVTHSTQLPGATGSSSGGRRHYVPALAKSALAIGADGIFLETHPDPDKALCDGPISLPLDYLPKLLKDLKRIWAAARAED